MFRVQHILSLLDDQNSDASSSYSDSDIESIANVEIDDEECEGAKNSENELGADEYERLAWY